MIVVILLSTKNVTIPSVQIAMYAHSGHTCMYVCMYVRTYVRTYVCMYASPPPLWGGVDVVCMQLRRLVGIGMYVCVYVCIYEILYVCMYVRTYIRR